MTTVGGHRSGAGEDAGLPVDMTATLFGRTGPRSRVRGWHTVTSRPVDDTALIQELTPFGTGVLSRPYDVPLTQPSE